MTSFVGMASCKMFIRVNFWGEISEKLHLHLSVVSLGANDILRLKKDQNSKEIALRGVAEVCTWAVGCWADRRIKARASWSIRHPPFLEHPRVDVLHPAAIKNGPRMSFEVKEAQI